MDSILSNPGFRHLGQQIFSDLDFKTLWRCRAVSPIWRDFIDSAFSDIVEKWRRFQIKGDFVIYQTTQNVKSMDYHPDLVEFIQGVASNPDQQCYRISDLERFDLILIVGIACVKLYGNIQNFFKFFIRAVSLAENEAEQELAYFIAKEQMKLEFGK